MRYYLSTDANVWDDSSGDVDIVSAAATVFKPSTHVQ